MPAHVDIASLDVRIQCDVRRPKAVGSVLIANRKALCAKLEKKVGVVVTAGIMLNNMDTPSLDVNAMSANQRWSVLS